MPWTMPLPGISLWERRYCTDLRNVAAIQARLLAQILRRDQATMAGCRHDFARLRTIRDYQGNVPLSTYADLAADIEKITAGAGGVRTARPVVRLALTSGTTAGTSKLVPQTAAHLRSARVATLASQAALRRRCWGSHGRPPHGVVMTAGSASTVSAGGLPISATSEMHLWGMRPLWSQFCPVPYAAMTVTDIEARIYACWRFALQARHVDFLGAPFPITLLLAADVLRRHADQLIRDLADGTLDPTLALGARARATLTRRLTADPVRARRLARAAEVAGHLRPRDALPELRWLLVAHSATLRDHEPALRDVFGHDFFWGMPYAAAEGLIGVPLFADSYQHVPAVRASFLEFLPEQPDGTFGGSPELLHELAAGARYEVVLTTRSGLHRYRLGDVVEVGGEYLGVLTLTVVGRAGGVLSIAGEKSTEAQLVAAVTALGEHLGHDLEDFLMTGDSYAFPPRYVLWCASRCELQRPADAEAVLDAQLRAANPHYDRVRAAGLLAAPEIRRVGPGALAEVRQPSAANAQPKTTHSWAGDDHDEMLGRLRRVHAREGW